MCRARFGLAYQTAWGKYNFVLCTYQMAVCLQIACRVVPSYSSDPSPAAAVSHIEAAMMWYTSVTPAQMPSRFSRQARNGNRVFH